MLKKTNKTTYSNDLEKKLLRNVIVFLILPVPFITLIYLGLPGMFVHMVDICFYATAIYSFVRLAAIGSLVIPRGVMRVLYVLFALFSIYIYSQIEFPPATDTMFFITCSYVPYISFLVPLVILLLPIQKHFDYVLHVFYGLSLLSIPLWLLNITQLVQEQYFGEAVGVYIPFFAVFLLGFLSRFNKKQKIMIIAIAAFYFILMTLNARRNMMLSIAFYGFVAYLLSMGKSRMQSLFAVLMGIFFVFMVIVNWSSLADNLFERVAERGTEDTRSDMEMYFFADYYDAPAEDWIIGRGAAGSYYFEQYNEQLDDRTYDRDVIETGYYNMILKGGFVYLVMILIYLIYALRVYWRERKLSHENIFMFIILFYNFLDFYMNTYITLHGVRQTIFWTMVAVAIGRNIQRKYGNVEKKRVRLSKKRQALLELAQTGEFEKK